MSNKGRTEVALRIAGRTVLFAVAYMLFAELGHALTIKENNFATFWPPSGLFVAALLLASRKQWGWTVLGGVCGNLASDILLHDRSWSVSIYFSTGNALEALLGAHLLCSLFPNGLQLRRPKEVLALTLLAGCLATTASAFIGAATVQAAFGAESYWQVWHVWWVGDVLGVLIFAPLLIIFGRAWQKRERLAWNRLWEVWALMGTSLLFLYFSFGQPFSANLVLVSFLLYPLLVWAGMRFGMAGTTLTMGLVAILAVWATTHDYGVFSYRGLDLGQKALFLQIYLGVHVTTSLLFAAIVEERRGANDSVHSHLKMLCAIIESTDDCIFAKDNEGHYLLLNSVAAKFLGKTPEAALGKTDIELFPEQFARLLIAQDQGILQSQRPAYFEEELPSTNGSVILLTTKSPLHDAEGNIRGIVGVSRDITSRKKIEAELRDSERRFRQMAETIGEIFWLREIDPPRFVYMNPAYETMFGKPSSELYDNPQSFSEVIHPEDLSMVMERFMNPVTPTLDQEYRVFRADGTIGWMHVHEAMVPPQPGEKTRFAGCAVDITNLRKAEDQLEQANRELTNRVEERTRELATKNLQLQNEIAERNRAEERLHQQQEQLTHATRLSTIGEMAAELAHEVNQPLYAMRNFLCGTLNGMKIGEATNASQIDAIQTAIGQVDRLANIVRRMKNFTRRGDQERQPAQLNEIVREVLQLTAPETRRRQVKIKLELEENLPLVQVEPVQMTQVIVNLVRNSLDALNGTEEQRRLLIIRTRSTETEVELSVQDTGPGVAEVVATRIFEPFYTTKKDGLGLGLSISRSILEAHGGMLTSDSNHGGGATFRVALPFQSAGTSG